MNSPSKPVMFAVLAGFVVLVFIGIGIVVIQQKKIPDNPQSTAQNQGTSQNEEPLFIEPTAVPVAPVSSDEAWVSAQTNRLYFAYPSKWIPSQKTDASGDSLFVTADTAAPLPYPALFVLLPTNSTEASFTQLQSVYNTVDSVKSTTYVMGNSAFKYRVVRDRQGPSGSLEKYITVTILARLSGQNIVIEYSYPGELPDDYWEPIFEGMIASIRMK